MKRKLTQMEAKALLVHCPLCLARCGEACVRQNTPIGERELCSRPHVERYEAARGKERT